MGSYQTAYFYNAPPQRIPNLTYRNRPAGGHIGIAFNPTPPLDAREERRTATWPDDVYASAIPAPYAIVEDASPKDKRGKGRFAMLGLLSLKEPSQAALKEFAAEQRKSEGLKNASAIQVNVRTQKLPDHVPKVNSKWDGMPSSHSQSKKSMERPSTSKSTTSRSAPKTSTGTSSSSTMPRARSDSSEQSYREEKGNSTSSTPPQIASGSQPGFNASATSTSQSNSVPPLPPPKPAADTPVTTSTLGGQSSNARKAATQDVLGSPAPIPIPQAPKSTPGSPKQNKGTFLASDDEEYLDFAALDGADALDSVLVKSIPILPPKRDIFKELYTVDTSSESSKSSSSSSHTRSRSIGRISASPKVASRPTQPSRVAIPAGVKLKRREELQGSDVWQQWPLPPNSSASGQMFGSAPSTNSASSSRSSSISERPYRPGPGSRSGLMTPPSSPPHQAKRTPSRSPSSLISSANAPHGNHIPRGIPPSILPGRVVTRDTDLDTIPESDTASILSRDPSLCQQQQDEVVGKYRGFGRVTVHRNEVSEVNGLRIKDDDDWEDAPDDEPQPATRPTTTYSFYPSQTAVQTHPQATGPTSTVNSSARSSSDFSTDMDQTPRERLGLGSNISYMQRYTPWLSMDDEEDLDIEFDEHGNQKENMVRKTATNRLIRALMK